MPNVFSKLAIPNWVLSALPYINNLFRQYGKHRTTVQRSIIFLLILRSILSIRQIVKAMNKKENVKTRKKNNKKKAEVQLHNI